MPPLQCQPETTPLEICAAHVQLSGIEVHMHVWLYTIACGLWPLMCMPPVMAGLGLPTQVKPVCGPAILIDAVSCKTLVLSREAQAPTNATATFMSRVQHIWRLTAGHQSAGSAG